VRVTFRRIDEPCVVTVEGPRGREMHELWPVIVDVVVRGERVPLRFAWDRHHHELLVDERWPGRALLGDAEARKTAAKLAKQALQAAASRASEG
jgi:hypothetical protein